MSKNKHETRQIQTPWQQLVNEGMRRPQIEAKLGVPQVKDCPDCPPGTHRVSFEKLAAEELATIDES